MGRLTNNGMSLLLLAPDEYLLLPLTVPSHFQYKPLSCPTENLIQSKASIVQAARLVSVELKASFYLSQLRFYVRIAGGHPGWLIRQLNEFLLGHLHFRLGGEPKLPPVDADLFKDSVRLERYGVRVMAKSNISVSLLTLLAKHR
jgi:hypothetical protein